MANIRVVSSLDDVATELQNLHITDIAQANDVQFQLDEQAPLQDAANMKVKIRPGRRGFILVNPELLECKFRAKMALDTSFNRMLKASMERIDQELQPIEVGIAALRVLVPTMTSRSHQMDLHLTTEIVVCNIASIRALLSRLSLILNMTHTTKGSRIKMLMLHNKRGMQPLLVTGMPRGPSGRSNSYFGGEAIHLERIKD